MADPLLSIIIPTIGRPTLGRTLRSLGPPSPAVDVLVIGDTYRDTYTPDLVDVPALCAAHGATYLPHDGGAHAWGHPQREYGDRLARGAWLWHLQDDTIATTPAVPALVALAADPHAAPVPVLARVDTWQAGVVWRSAVLALGNCDADGIVVPNDPTRRPPWGRAYNDDFVFLSACVAAYDGALRYLSQIVAIGRPERAAAWPAALVGAGVL
jgi:hypothetical protein